MIELAASEISFGPVASSVFEFTPPANAKVEEVTLPSGNGKHAANGARAAPISPKITPHGTARDDRACSKARPSPDEQRTEPARRRCRR